MMALATSLASARVGRGIVNHAFQHLGGGNHGNAAVVALANDHFLQHGHLLGPHFYPQVAPRHHNGIATSRMASRFSMAWGFSILASTNTLFAPFSFRIDFRANVFGLADKTQGNDIDPLGNTKVEILQVFFGQGGQLQVQIW
jgi:hypothetical protein